MTNESTIVLASGNKGKLREFQEILAGYPFTVCSQSEFSVPECDETGLSFVENAILKARNAAAHCQLPAIADDSGIVVDALNGEPGIYSARYAGAGASDERNLEKLIDEFTKSHSKDTRCRFVCAMVYVRHAKDPQPIICEGLWEGTLLTSPRGEHGFGYDPIFLVPGLERTSAELEPEAKNRISHRGQALNTLIERLKPIYRID